MPTKFFTNQDDNSLLKKFEGEFTKIKGINVEGNQIAIIQINNDDYISLTYMAKSQHQEVVIFKWMSSKSTIEYLGEWELLYNPNFNYTEFGIIKNEAGTNSFVLSTKNWIEKTNAIGIIAKAGRYGGTYAHKDIPFHFGMWISAEGRNTGNTHY